MSDHDDVDLMPLEEVQRERLKSARERQQSLALIASYSRWTAILVAAHAGVGVLQGAPSVHAADAALLFLALPLVLWSGRRGR